MKTVFSKLVAAGGLVGLLATGPSSALAATCGDINGNGSLNISDSNLLSAFLAGSVPGSSLCGGQGVTQCGDVDNNGGVGVADLVKHLSSVTGVPTLFPLCQAAPAPIACNTNVRGNINSSQTWPAGCDTFVDGTVFVNPPAVLTIQAGATVKGRKTSFNGTPSVLIIQRGAKIDANGTAANPIVFTSDAAPGSRTQGDWGGVVINGRAPVNCPGGECLAEGLINVPFGGSDADDSSGRVRFARVEFSGIELSPDNELNVFTMNGVGRNTLIERVMAKMGFDDCFEWFGGTVNAKYLVSGGCRDDGLDWQLGYIGNVQYALYIQNNAFTNTGGRHGYETDNNENGFDFIPRSNPTFCNTTVVGTASQGGTNGNHGIAFRRGTAGKIVNSIIANWRQNGVNIGDNPTIARGCTGPAAEQTTEPLLRVQQTMFVNNVGGTAGGSASSPCTPAQMLSLWVTNQGVLDNPSNPGFTAATLPYPSTVSDVNAYVPAPGSDAVGGANCKAYSPFFDTTNYKGAFAPGAATWLSTPWIDWAVN